MEKALQDCCRSMRIGKILIDSDSDSQEAYVVFAKFVEDIANRKVSAKIRLVFGELFFTPFCALFGDTFQMQQLTKESYFQVLLLYPIISSGSKVCKAVQVLKEHQVFSKKSICLKLEKY